MAYCTTTQVKQILDRVESLLRDAELDLTNMIAVAQPIIDAELEAAGIQVPMSTPPVFVQQATANYVAYLAVRRVNTTGGFDTMMTEFKDEYQRLLDEFRSGLADFPGETMIRERTPVPVVVNRRGSHS